ncbi:glycoside hydrolase family 88 protein [Ructibacterium gallinarum]|nr:glycoside hydrolase family 88 protein [Ructibacterium gallinarum]
MKNEKLEKGLSYSLKQVDRLMNDFPNSYPADQSTNYVYPEGNGNSWTEGFWPGMLNLAYEFTHDAKYQTAAEHEVQIFKKRIDNQISVEHHDLGFLYTPSCVAAWKLYHDEDAKAAAVEAANTLLRRFRPIGGFLQAWGPMDDDPKNYRLIIDCMLNIPLLFWATEATGDPKYREHALSHLNASVQNVIRKDYTTYHTFYFDPKTGAPDRGVTHQGYSDNSIWARGQAWGIYGLALSYHYTHDPALLPLYRGVTQVFIDKLPKDKVPFWDMIFTDGDDQPRDSSSAAIAICGILEMEKYESHPELKRQAEQMTESLIDHYLTERIPESNGILTDGMYSRPNGHEPECNIWGDYFFMEALMRLKNPDWKMYW